MILDGQEDVTAAVRLAMADTPDPRLHQIMDALVRHAHAFIREVQPTEQEFEQGLDFLGAVGRACTDRHNEMVLFADVIGVSTLACLLSDRRHGATEPAAALLGAFWRDHSPVTQDGGSLLRSPTRGPKLFVRGVVREPDGRPVAGARVDVWHASPAGLYEHEDSGQAEMNLRGRFETDAEGGFRFVSVRPAAYPVPTSGPVGALLRAQRRYPFRPAHLHFLIHRPGYRTLVTQVFVNEDDLLERDIAFGVARPLIGSLVHHDGPAPDGSVGEWYSLDHAFTLRRGRARLPRPPIA
ncbi:dioxygenase family protein [Paracraurococcus lichenis]|uniref:Dioxygenase n=1 Tax=Paracraurococcus lichenis TaxID=3064888 RepID=A0ABT9E6K8_9PROT|nr:dioxygenase [Paracraurococcus sp. LOR1-02]MDO9711789.1 dioxygenase [Paracraurococcus sp. LOR1-02]